MISTLKKMWRILTVLLVALMMGVSETFAGISAASGLEYGGTVYAPSIINAANFSDTARHWANSSIARAAAMGVLLGENGRFFPERPVSREEALTVLVRMIGGEQLPSGKRAAANLSASDWAMDYVSAAIQMGFVERSEIALDFKKSSARQEVFTWVAKAMKIKPTSYTGAALFFKDYGDIEKDRLPYIIALAQKGITAGWNGRFYPNRTMTRGELAALVDKIKGDPVFGLSVKRGWIISVYENASDVVYEVKTEDGPIYELKVIRGKTDFPVIRDGKIYGSRALSRGDYAAVFLKGSQVVFAEVAGYVNQRISGELIDIKGGFVYIKDGRGSVFSFKLPEYPEVYVYGKKGNIYDLLPGVEVTAFATNGTLSRIEVTAVEGGALAYSFRYPLEGTVKQTQKSDEGLEVTVRLPSGGDETLMFPEDVSVIKNGKSADLADIRPGNKIMVYFDAAGYGSPVRVELSTSGTVDGIIKGTLMGGIPGESLVLSNIKEFYFGIFREKENLARLRITEDTKIYGPWGEIGSEELISNYKGKELYVALNGEYGEKRALKVVVKTGREYGENGFIKDARWSTGEMAVGDLETLFDESAIAVLGGALVSPDFLEDEKGTFLVVNKNASGSKAAIIYQPEFYESTLKILKGQIYEIKRDSIAIRFRSELEESLWSSETSKSSDFELYDDAVIVDATADIPKKMSKKELLMDRYEENYYYKNAYVILKDDKVLAMVIKNGGRSDDTVSLGTLKGVSGNQITLSDMLDYNQFNERWNLNLDTLEIHVGGAVIMRGKEFIEADDLESGDFLYVIRENNVCLLAFAF
ncbi:MAG: hypothetical protein PWP45_552 [Tepidanaerobacteraceae bacterium]|nr:hypothetical protein [Tepidanaerobacteraceae bacterium]